MCVCVRVYVLKIVSRDNILHFKNTFIIITSQPVLYGFFSACLQRMSQRLSGYHLVASNARLRQQLAAKGGYLPSGDFISSRMAELKGSPTHSPRR